VVVQYDSMAKSLPVDTFLLSQGTQRHTNQPWFMRWIITVFKPTLQTYLIFFFSQKKEWLIQFQSNS